MAQETRNVDYESMVNKYMNEWEGSNLREFCFSEKVNIYRMIKAMKKMGVKKELVPYGLKPLEFTDAKARTMPVTTWPASMTVVFMARNSLAVKVSGL